MVWTLVIGLVASIVGGIIAGLLVVRVITYNNKRFCANQIYEDFEFMYQMFCHHTFNHLKSLGYSRNDISSRPVNLDDLSPKSDKNLLGELHEWLVRNAQRELSKQDSNKLMESTNYVIKEGIDGDTGFRTFMTKYSVQVSHFDKLYIASSVIEMLKSEINEPTGGSESEEEKRGWVSIYTAFMLEFIAYLSLAYDDIQYYFKAKPFTWRLLLPIAQN